MPTESISWVDSTGPATLSNGKPIPATRFGNWTPRRVPVGPAKTRLGSGRLDRFEFRRDDLFSFEIAAIPGTAANLELALRLQYHLLNGGVVMLTSTRPLSDTFLAYSLAENTEPEIDFSDRNMYEYTFSVTLKGLTESEIEAGAESPPTEDPAFEWWYAARLETAYEDNDDVGTATDFKDGLYPATVATGWKPKYKTNQTPNGGPVFDFVSVNGNGNFSGYVGHPASAGEPQYLASPLIAIPTAGMTIFTVAKRDGAHVEHGIFWRFASATGNSHGALKETHGGDGSTDKVKWDDSSSHIITASLSTDWFIHAIRFESATTVRQYYNGVDVGSFDPATGADQILAMFLGSGGEVQIAEQHGFVDAISDSSMVRRHAYLSAIHGIALDTP